MQSESRLDPLTFGQRLRYLRRAKGLTLDALGSLVGKHASFLSLIENGHREARLSLIEALANALDVQAGDLLSPEAPNRRAHLEIELERAQHEPQYRELELPWIKPSAQVPSHFIEHVLRLYDELKKRSPLQAKTLEAVRRANKELRQEMSSCNNYFSEVEEAAADALAAGDYEGTGPVADRVLNGIIASFGFTLHRVQDLPECAWSVTDLANRRIYVKQRNELSTRGARTVVLQTLGRFVLGHTDPADLGQLLRQQVEANYFAAAVLVPEEQTVQILTRARREGDISAEELRQYFYVSYEMAAHRLTNLLTHHFHVPVHFLRSDKAGIISKAYENDGVPLPSDSDGIVEGQPTCRRWGARQAFGTHDEFADHAQYTTTAAGTYWCITHVDIDTPAHQAVTLGARAQDARYFRGHQTTNTATSTCPDERCCQKVPDDLASSWDGKAWPSIRVDSTMLATLPTGPLDGVDQYDIYQFLERHAPTTRSNREPGI